jgi:hypothetical protein
MAFRNDSGTTDSFFGKEEWIDTLDMKKQGLSK